MKKYRKYLIILLIIISIAVAFCFIPFGISKFIPSIENAVKKDLGLDVKLEKLVLKFGPELKLKTPVVYLMYGDGQKFAQLNSVRFYVTWGSIIKHKPVIKTIKAGSFSANISSDDEYFKELVSILEQKDISEIPDIKLKDYTLSYINRDLNDKYSFSGQEFEIEKLLRYKNFKVKTKGYFGINNKQYINYDISLVPNFDLPKEYPALEISALSKNIVTLDFHSDLVADLKLYKNANGDIQSSGFINVDNISVLDPTGHEPKSFAYITLWGDKAGILSNIYTDGNRKICIEGMVNNSKKPVVDVKVKTDEIRFSDLYKKLKVFAELSGLNKINSVSGTLSANFALKGDLDKIKSNGYLKVKDAGVKAGNIEVNRINADIDFSNNTINISNAAGYVNNSPIIAKGYIDKSINVDLLMDKVELKHLLPAYLGIKKGILSLNANLRGTLEKPVHKEILQVENLETEYKGCNFAIENLKIDTNKNNTAYVNNVTIKTPKTNMIKVPSMRVLIDQDSIKIPETNIFMPNSKLTAKSEILNFNNNEMSFNTLINGFINTSDIVPLKSDASIYPVKMSINGNKILQNINAQLLIEKTSIFDEPTIVSLNSKLSKNSLKIEDLALMGFNGSFSDDFKQNLKGAKKLIIAGGIENLDKSPNFKNLRIFTPQILNVSLSDLIAQLKCDLFLNGDIKTPEIVGQLLMQNLHLQIGQTTVTNATADFNKNTVAINAPLIKITDSTLGFNAIANIDFSKVLTFRNVNIKSKYFNADTLLMYKDAPLMKNFPIEISDGKFYAEKVYSTIYGSKIYLSALTCDLKLSNNLLNLKNISSEIFNGKLQGNIDFNLKDETFNSDLMARSVSASPIFNIVSARKESVSGVMDFDSIIKGNLSSKKSISGDVKFIIHNGRMATLGKLEHLLYAQNVLADNMLRTSLSIVTKAITLKDTGLFKYLRGDVSIKDGIANIKMLQSQGPLMALFIKGSYQLDTDYAQLYVLGRLSDEVVSGLGAFGDFSFNKLLIMLTGEDKKYNIAPQDLENLPQLTGRNTKEFRSVINGIIDKPSSVIMFNWISYSQKSLRQKEVPMTNVKVPAFVDDLPY